MIRVEIEEYCHSCLDFCPDVIEPTRCASDTGENFWSDTIILCKYRKRCAGIERYLRQQAKEEASG